MAMRIMNPRFLALQVMSQSKCHRFLDMQTMVTQSMFQRLLAMQTPALVLAMMGLVMAGLAKVRLATLRVIMWVSHPLAMWTSESM